MKKGPEETNSPPESCPSKTDARTFYKNERSQKWRNFHEERSGRDQLSCGELSVEDGCAYVLQERAQSEVEELS